MDFLIKLKKKLKKNRFKIKKPSKYPVFYYLLDSLSKNSFSSSVKDIIP
jgi:hypothetical protein